MLGRRKKRVPNPQGGTPNEVVASCEAYSERLKEKPVRVKLHVSSGRIADGNIGLEAVEGGGTQLVVQAHGSILFGLVKRDFRHVFKVGELERSRSTHTAFLLRSIKVLAKGDGATRKDLLARSLSLVHRNEAVDVTFASDKECDQLGQWIDAKWSVSMIQKSFRKPSRIEQALEGKNKSLDDQGVYDVIKEARGESEVDGAGFGRLPKLDPALKRKLQDDLLDGMHVTHHDLALGGYLSSSSPRRLRYDCQSQDGLIYLEPSFEGDGDPIVEPISSLIQVGGGPSAHGPTAALLRATEKNSNQRASAVSLVFSARSMDITCGCYKDAIELVLYFSEVKGFTRAKPPSRSLLMETRDLGIIQGVSGQEGVGGHRDGSPPLQQHGTAASVCAAGAAMLNMRSAPGAVDPSGGGVLQRSAPKERRVGGQQGVAGPANPREKTGQSFSTRFRNGFTLSDAEAFLEKQLSASSGFSATSSLLGGASFARRQDGVRMMEGQSSAASGFGATPSMRNFPATLNGGGGGGGGVVQQRMWPTRSSSPVGPSAFTAKSMASGALAFRSNPGQEPARRATVGGGVPDSLDRSGGGRRRGEGAGGAWHGGGGGGGGGGGHSGASSTPPPPTYSQHPHGYQEAPPPYDVVAFDAHNARRGGGGGGGSGLEATVRQRAAGTLPQQRRRGVEAGKLPVREVTSSKPHRRSNPSDYSGGAIFPREGGGERSRNGAHRSPAREHHQFSGPRSRSPTAARSRSPTSAAAAAAAATPGREGQRAHWPRTPPSPRLPPPPPRRQPAASVDPESGPLDRSRGASITRSRSPIDRRPRHGDGAGHTVGSNVDRSRGGRGGDSDDDSYATVPVKGARPPNRTHGSDELENSGYGRRRATDSHLDGSGRSGGHSPTSHEGQRQRRSTFASAPGVRRQGNSPAKERLHRTTAGIGKALRGRVKLFSSSGGGALGKKLAATNFPLSPTGYGGGAGRALGPPEPAAQASKGNSRFGLSSRGGNSSAVGGVDDFTAASTATASSASKFRSSPGMVPVRTPASASATEGRHS